MPAHSQQPARSQETEQAPQEGAREDVVWRRLAFTATKLLFTAHANVELDWLEPAKASDQLLEDVPGKPLQPKRRLGAIELRSRFIGRRSSNTTWFDPTTLAAYQSASRDYGKRNRLKIYRYGEEAVFSRRLRPANHAEGEQEPASWSDRTEEVHKLDTHDVLSDPSMLFYILATADPMEYAKGGKLMAYAKGDAQPIEIELVGFEPLHVSYEVFGPSSPEDDPEKVKGDIETIHYALRPGADADELKLLGLDGDLDLWFEAQRRIPVQVSGRVSPVGKVVVRLKAAWLRKPGDDGGRETRDGTAPDDTPE